MDSLGKLNAAVYRSMQSILNLKLQDTEIRSGQYDFFFVISKKQGLTQKELTEHMFVEKSTTAKAVKDLEKKGFIRKVKDKDDGRRELLYLTEKGRELEEKVKRIYRESVKRAASTLNPEEDRLLRELLTRVLGNLIEEKRDLMSAQSKPAAKSRRQHCGGR